MRRSGRRRPSGTLSVIGIFDLTTQARNVVSDTFMAFDIWLTAAAIYSEGYGAVEHVKRTGHGLEHRQRCRDDRGWCALAPAGSEASHLLRVEKGFLSLAHEVDSTADPIDLGMPWILFGTKPDYLGKREIEIRRGSKRVRRELVGLLATTS